MYCCCLYHLLGINSIARLSLALLNTAVLHAESGWASTSGLAISASCADTVLCHAVFQRQMSHVHFEHENKACDYFLQPDDS